jgi:pimeloyl-ACP methyl ester carboxylesterase
MTYAEYWFESHDGLKLFSRVYSASTASAPVVLCLHGLTRNSRDFEDLAPHLAGRYRVVVPDVRGRGLSQRDSDPNNYKMPVYLRDLELLLGGLGADKVAIIGTSMGGLMAMTLAATRPERVSRIVLNDVGPELDPAGLERIRRYAGCSPAVATWAEAVAQSRLIFGAAWPNIAEARWEAIARRSYRMNAAGMLEPDADPMIGEVVRNSAGAGRELWPLWGGLRQVPVLALRGQLSDLLSAQTLARMQREKPDLQTAIIAERGHTPLLDEPECLDRIDRFLEARPPPSKTSSA